VNRIIVLLCWVVFLAWGGWTIGHRPDTKTATAVTTLTECLTTTQKKSMRHVVARRDMGVNWRIGASDVYQSGGSGGAGITEFVGKYVVCKAALGDAVVGSDLASRPSVSPAAGKVLYLLRLRSGEEESLNATKHVVLFRGPTAGVTNAEILAVLCDSACDAVLQLTPAEVELLKLTDPLEMKKVLLSDPLEMKKLAR
jgi:hypothetical protein